MFTQETAFLQSNIPSSCCFFPFYFIFYFQLEFPGKHIKEKTNKQRKQLVGGLMTSFQHQFGKLPVTAIHLNKKEDIHP